MKLDVIVWLKWKWIATEVLLFNMPPPLGCLQVRDRIHNPLVAIIFFIEYPVSTTT